MNDRLSFHICMNKTHPQSIMRTEPEHVVGPRNAPFLTHQNIRLYEKNVKVKKC